MYFCDRCGELTEYIGQAHRCYGERWEEPVELEDPALCVQLFELYKKLHNQDAEVVVIYRHDNVDRPDIEVLWSFNDWISRHPHFDFLGVNTENLMYD